MRTFFAFSVAYVLVAILVLFVSRDHPGAQLYDGLVQSIQTARAFVGYLPAIVVGLALLATAGSQFVSRQSMAAIGWGLGACLLFPLGFTFVKSSMPFISPFYADPALAAFDRALHGGVDPWQLTHVLAPYIDADFISLLYFVIWGLPAAFLPVIIATCDNDLGRRNRFLVLYAFIWIGLGNVLAYAGSSVGPVFYDQLMGTDRFADLAVALQASGLAQTEFALIQDRLWALFEAQSQSVGSGISAFPSIHNGVATIVMLYLWERSRWLAPVGLAFSGLILFSSVYVGWHYAVDGYASIALVTLAWTGLRRLDLAPRAAVQQATPAPVMVPAE